jgi:hypothetical protein
LPSYAARTPTASAVKLMIKMHSLFFLNRTN